MGKATKTPAKKTKTGKKTTAPQVKAEVVPVDPHFDLTELFAKIDEAIDSNNRQIDALLARARG